MGPAGLKSRCWQDWVPSGGSRENTSHVSSCLQRPPHPLAHGPLAPSSKPASAVRLLLWHRLFCSPPSLLRTLEIIPGSPRSSRMTSASHGYLMKQPAFHLQLLIPPCHVTYRSQVLGHRARTLQGSGGGGWALFCVLQRGTWRL